MKSMQQLTDKGQTVGDHGKRTSQKQISYRSTVRERERLDPDVLQLHALLDSKMATLVVGMHDSISNHSHLLRTRHCHGCVPVCFHMLFLPIYPSIIANWSQGHATSESSFIIPNLAINAAWKTKRDLCPSAAVSEVNGTVEVAEWWMRWLKWMNEFNSLHRCRSAC